MTTYNEAIIYNQPLLTYNGIILVISDHIVINTETVSVLEIIDIPAYGSTSTDVIDKISFALSSIVNDESETGYSLVLLDKENSHAVISLNPNADKSAAGSFSITIISNV